MKLDFFEGMNNMNFDLTQIISTILGSGILVSFIEAFRKQREFVATMLAFKNECVYNSRHRGNINNPFQIEWLGKILGLLEFHEQCSNIALISLKAFELSKEANIDQLTSRPVSPGVRMVPSCVQSEFNNIIREIDKIMPDLEVRTELIMYIFWHFTLVLQKTYNVFLKWLPMFGPYIFYFDFISVYF